MLVVSKADQINQSLVNTAVVLSCWLSLDLALNADDPTFIRVICGPAPLYTKQKRRKQLGGLQAVIGLELKRHLFNFP